MYAKAMPGSTMQHVRANRPPASVAAAYANKQHTAIKGFMQAFGYKQTAAAGQSKEGRTCTYLAYLGLGYGCV